MKLYRNQKEEDWAKGYDDKLLYSVFLCYAEDSFALEEGLELNEIEAYLV